VAVVPLHTATPGPLVALVARVVVVKAEMQLHLSQA